MSEKKKEEPSIASAVVGYWILTICLFLLFSVPLLMVMHPDAVGSSSQGFGWMIVMYLVVLMSYGWIPAVVALILNAVNLVRLQSFSEKHQQLVKLLCGRVLLNIPIGVGVMMLAPLSRWVCVLAGAAYGVWLLVPWVIVKVKKLV